MRARRLATVTTVLALLGAAPGCDPGEIDPPGTRRDGGVDGRGGGDGGRDSGPPPPCVDSDGDGINDMLEIAPGGDNDNDMDGFADDVEANGNYPGYSAMRPAATCATRPDDCDMDGVLNFRDTDSDNDGLTDAEERMAMTNPCAADTDGDSIDDLTERVAMSDPRSMMSRPPEGSLYVVLPYHPPGTMGERPTREFAFSTRLRAADIMFVVDTTGSMGSTIANVQSTLMSRIIPGIVSAIGASGNVRYGLAGYGDFAEGGTNYTGNVTVFQRMTRDAMAVQRATSMLRADNGGDTPESAVPALHSLIDGFGQPQYGGTATRRVNPPTDCMASPDGPETYGWACFEGGRVPVLVLFTDSAWHNGPERGNDYTSAPMTPRYADLLPVMMRRGAYFVGISVGNYTQGGFNTPHMNAIQLARETRTLDGMGQPIAFNGSASTVADNVVSAITTIVGQSRQDITTRVDPDRMEMRLMAPNTTANFIRAVRPLRGTPAAPMGYDRHDMTTFYNVAPSTSVIFEVEFYNDFHPGGSAAQVFRAKIVVLGRAMSEVDSRDVFIVVPAMGGGPPG